MNKNHGSPYDRGTADYYYYRDRCPHYWPAGTYNGRKVTEIEMTKSQIAEYHLGYDEELDRKDWG